MRAVPRRILVAGAGVLLAASCTASSTGQDDGAPPTSGEGATPSTGEATTTTAPPDTRLVPAATVGQPWGGAVQGSLTFRGNPSRTWYGAGPLPQAPRILWRFPSGGGMCSESTVGDETKLWCGTGWTGQPAVFERDGRTWVVFGAYDRAVHFLDGATGERILPDFPTGDIIKGSVTVDPDGFPLVYTGSRDNAYRVIAIDRARPTELWRLNATDVSPTLWNNDWDGAGLVLGDHLIEGGENSQLHIARLNRAYATDGLVSVDPALVFHAPGWDDQLLRELGDRNVSIESSVAVLGDTAWFANSGGLLQGWDLAGLADGTTPTRTFRFWVGDDTDATVVADAEGMLYVAVEWDRATRRAAEVGQLLKIDPSRPDDPVVWSIEDQGATPAGFWATPALHRDVVIAPTDGGRLLGVDRATGAIRWEKKLPGPVWQSPVVVDDVLLQGDCNGVLHAYDVSDTTVDPPELWTVKLAGCIESTPAVWGGRIYVGTRAGQLVAIGD